MVEMVLLTLSAAALLVWLGVAAAPAYRHNLTYQLAADRPIADADLPFVAIICPGRNEAAHLPRTLPALCEQEYPAYEVIFIDDDSDDATPAITAALVERYPHLRVVRNDTPPPAGWVGKCWAVWRGVEDLRQREADDPSRSPAPWVCFTDADIDWDPACLRHAMRHQLEHEADVVGLLPNMRFESTAERVGVSILVLALLTLFPFRKAMDPAHPDTLTGGAFMLVRRGLYDAIGGHESVRGQVVEDLNLGRRLKAAGGVMRLAITPTLLNCRMYDGWADMWEGLTKNAFAGLEYSWLRVAAALGASMAFNVLVPVYLAVGVVGAMFGGWSMGWLIAGLAAGAMLMQAVPMNAVRRQFDLPWRYAFNVPTGSAMYVLFIVASVWRYYRGGNVWKGRSYGPAIRA